MTTQVVTPERLAAARELRELAAALSNGGAVVVRSIGTDDERTDRELADRLIDYAQLIDGMTLEEAAAAIE